MITRHAILIGSFNLTRNGQPDIPGVIHDINDYQKYLLSNVGGAWEENEITHVFNPPTAYLQSLLAQFGGVDYLFFAFSGHGDHFVADRERYTRIELNSQEAPFPVPHLIVQNTRSLVVIDACRNIMVETLRKEMIKKGMIGLAGLYYGVRAQCRATFDNAVAGAEEGNITIFSCSVGQSAGDDPRSGGHFTQALLEGAENLADSHAGHPNQYWGINQVFDVTPEIMAQALRQAPRFNQNPEMYAHRRQRFFPFAICE